MEARALDGQGCRALRTAPGFCLGYRYAVAKHQRGREMIDEQCLICDTGEVGACDDSMLDMMKLGCCDCRAAATVGWLGDRPHDRHGARDDARDDILSDMERTLCGAGALQRVSAAFVHERQQ